MVILRGSFKIIDVQELTSGQGNTFIKHEVRDTQGKQALSIMVSADRELTPADFTDAGLECDYNGTFANIPNFRVRPKPKDEGQKKMAT